MSFTLDKLTEGIRQRNMGAQHQRLTEKWNRTGLLRGLEGQSRENMSVLLENQAAQLLREANTLGASGTTGTGPSASGDIRGFQNIAFPIVRRVFGGLVANDLVSIQPMSLPAGLLFYLDYTYGNDVGGQEAGSGAASAVYDGGQSIYNNPSGAGVRSGSLATGGQYDLAGAGFSRRHSFNALTSGETAGIAYGCWDDSNAWKATDDAHITAVAQFTGSNAKWMQFDPQVKKGLEDAVLKQLFFAMIPANTTYFNDAQSRAADLTLIKDIAITPDASTGAAGEHDDFVDWGEDFQGGLNIFNLRRLNQLVTWDGSGLPTAAPLAAIGDTNAYVLTVCRGNASVDISNMNDATGATILDLSFAIGPDRVGGDSGDSVVVPSFESNLLAGASNKPVIPEIDIKIESISVTAATRKLRARWTPELAQDLNAYHSLDAEVELTQILSEQIALELDREILNDLLTQANGANLYWSRSPGQFVNKETGVAIARGSSLRPGPAFTGTVREWYETLAETIIDAANTIHRKTLRGSANFVVVGPDVATILESSVMYKPVYSLDGDGQVGNPMTIGAEKVGSLSNRFTVYKDPYFPRNKILIGYKGGSYLETGYVYAPYVPLIVTPTIFAPEDFTPRKGVMTRYGKKMVRSDFYGTVTVLDLNII
tara:strand:+ start:16966 stop:18930 length:1965 start_codon:yes stop_codon:yes gene_type:complete